MITIVKTPSDKVFYKLINDSKNELLLCAPFIKKEIINKILKIKQSNAKMVVITSSNYSHFLRGSLDLDAIKILIDNGIEVRNYQEMHAKIYIFDKSKALITSANLTNKALYHNFEYGLLVQNDDAMVEKIRDDYIEMIDSDLCGGFTKKVINDIENNIKNFREKPFTYIDEDEDTIINVSNIHNLNRTMSSWKKDVFNCIQKINKQEFTLKDIYEFSGELSQAHPNNNNVEAKIRQMLQQLRDIGLIKFTKKGEYKKLWDNYFPEKITNNVELYA